MIEVSEYLTKPLRSLYDACRQLGQDDGARRCPTCVVRDLCESGGNNSTGRPTLFSNEGTDPGCFRRRTRHGEVRKKAAVITAIRVGVIAREQAYARYLPSPEELAAWERAFDQGGHRALSGKAGAPASRQGGARKIVRA